MFALPGTPTLFYGEEIGMGENLAIEDRYSVRTPMQWTDGPTAGFSSAPPDALCRPLPTDRAFDADAVNVRDQRRDPESLLNWFERLIRLRKELPEIGWGKCTVVDGGKPAIVVLHHEWQDRVLVTAHNLGRRVAVATVEIPGVTRGELREMLGSADTIAVRNGRARIRVGPHEQRWLRLQPHPART